jgi:hypothetical protein
MFTRVANLFSNNPVFKEQFEIIKGSPPGGNNERRKINISQQFDDKVLPRIIDYIKEQNKQTVKTLEIDTDSAISRTITSITIHYAPSVIINDFSTKYPTWTNFLDAIENQTVCTQSGLMTISFDLSKLLKTAAGGRNRRRKSRKQYRQRCAMRRVKNKTMRSRKRKVARSVQH